MLIIWVSIAVLAVGVLLLILDTPITAVGAVALVIGISFTFGFVGSTIINNRPRAIFEQIQADSVQREEIIANYEKAVKSHDKHTLTSAVALIEMWNGEVKERKKKSESVWVGCMYPDEVADALKEIEVKDE